MGQLRRAAVDTEAGQKVRIERRHRHRQERRFRPFERRVNVAVVVDGVDAAQAEAAGARALLLGRREVVPAVETSQFVVGVSVPTSK